MPAKKSVSKASKAKSTRNYKKSAATPVEQHVPSKEEQSEEEAEQSEQEEKPKKSQKAKKDTKDTKAKSSKKRKVEEEPEEEEEKDEKGEESEEEPEEYKVVEVEVDDEEDAEYEFVDKEGKPVDEKKATRKKSIPASDSEQKDKYKEMVDLLKYYKGRIPLVYIERGNRIYHPVEVAAIVDFPTKNSILKQTYECDGIKSEKPNPVITYLKKLRGKKPRKQRNDDGKKKRKSTPTAKPWQELYFPDKKGVYRRLGSGKGISIKYRPSVFLPIPGRKNVEETEDNTNDEHIKPITETKPKETKSKQVATKTKKTTPKNKKTKDVVLSEEALERAEFEAFDNYRKEQEMLKAQREAQKKNDLWGNIVSMYEERPALNEIFMKA
jgi:hypothetical protein